MTEEGGVTKHNTWANLSLILALGGLAGLVVTFFLQQRPGISSPIQFWFLRCGLWIFMLMSLVGMLVGIVTFILSFRRRIGGRWRALAGGLLGGLPVLLALVLVATAGSPQYEDTAATVLHVDSVLHQQFTERAARDPNFRFELANVASLPGYDLKECATIAGKSVGKGQGCARCATPLKYGGKTRRTFIVRLDDAVVWAKDLGKAQHIEDFPADPASSGWEKVCDKNGLVYPNGLPALPEEAKSSTR